MTKLFWTTVDSVLSWAVGRRPSALPNAYLSLTSDPHPRAEHDEVLVTVVYPGRVVGTNELTGQVAVGGTFTINQLRRPVADGD